MQRRTVAVTLAAAWLLVACGVGTPTKDGGAARVIRLAQSDNLTTVSGRWYNVPNEFLAAISDVSGDRLTVHVDATTYADGAPDQESRLVRDLAAGKVDATFTPTRAYANAGIRGLGILEAPFVISSMAAEKAVVTSPLADALLDRLAGTGVVGLALAVGPLRRPVSGHSAMLSPQDFVGQRFRSYNSPIQDAAITALGGRPVHDAYSWADRIREGQLEGAETDLAAVWDGDRSRDMFMPTNVVLWPKVYLLAVSQRFYDGLNDQQRGWLRRAAERVRDASAAATYDESALAQLACTAGMRFAEATAADVAELHQAARSVLRELDADPLLAREQAIVAEHPAVDVLGVGETCLGPAPSQSDMWPTTGPAVPMLPNGTYRTRITESQVLAAGYANGDGWSGEWKLEVRDGHYALSCLPVSDNVHDCGNGGSAVYQGPLESGSIVATGHTLRFRSDRDDYTAGGWHADGDTVVFDRPTNGSPRQLWIQPWSRIG